MTAKCHFCVEKYNNVANLNKHYIDKHSIEIEQAYIQNNMERIKMAAMMGIGESSLKKILKHLGLKKTKTSIMKNTWKNLSEKQRMNRIKNTSKKRKKSLKMLESSIENLRKARKTTERKTQKREQEIIDKLNLSKRIAYSHTNKRIYRNWRENKGSLYCDICKRVNSGRKNSDFMIDHDHTTLQIRGMLCFQCNILLGWIDNNHYRIYDYLSKDTSFSYKKERNIFVENFDSGAECEICEKVGIIGLYGLVVDHNHETGNIRGILCNADNMRLGRFEKRIDVITRYREMREWV